MQPDDVLITERLYRRRARPACLERELSAYRELSSMMAVSPSAAIQRFLDLAIELCPPAASAGLSELVREGDECMFEWTALSGALAPHVGGSTPCDFSPCGLCLDHHHTILVDRPGRLFTYLNEAAPLIAEGLIVPLYDTGKRAIGTLWVVSHDPDAKFDATDARVMEQLAVQLVLAIKLRRKAEIAARLEETSRDNQMLVHEVRHRVKNMLQMTSSLLELQERGTRSSEARAALKEANSRLMVLASVYENLLQPGADSREVDICELLRALVGALRESSPSNAKIAVETSCEQLKVGVTQAVPLGLLVNEAVTNSLKHAFVGRSRGTIVIRLAVIGDGCLLTISDDGKGFTGDPRPGSLGMRLMNRLARQLQAKFSVDASDGTTVAVRWPMRSGQVGDVSLALAD